MNAYFFKMSQAERNNILDQHKQVYDGFVTNFGQQINQQPLYVQDFANDKAGLTVNNKGEVKTYTNMRINESDAFTGAKYLPDVTFDFGGPDDEFESEYVGFDGRDRIGDSPSDMSHGTFGDDPEGLSYELELGDMFPEEETFTEFDISDLDSDVDVEEIEPLQEQLNKTLDMFKRFKNF